MRQVKGAQGGPYRKNESTGNIPGIETTETMQTPAVETFGSMLRQARLGRGWGSGSWAARAGLDASYINRLEGGNAGREGMPRLLWPRRWGSKDRFGPVAGRGGHAPVTLLPEIGGAVRTRGGMQGFIEERGASEESRPDALVRLEKIGLQESGIGGLFRPWRPLTRTGGSGRRLSRGLLAGLAQRLESPARCAVIPAAGGQHRLLAPAVMQRLLLRVMAEAAEEGIATSS